MSVVMNPCAMFKSYADNEWAERELSALAGGITNREYGRFRGASGTPARFSDGGVFGRQCELFGICRVTDVDFDEHMPIIQGKHTMIQN